MISKALVVAISVGFVIGQGGCGRGDAANEGAIAAQDAYSINLDPSSTVSRLVQEGQRYAHASACGMYCSCL